MSPAVDSSAAPATPTASGGVAALLSGAAPNGAMTDAVGAAGAPTSAPASAATTLTAAANGAASTAGGADLEAFLRVLASTLAATTSPQNAVAAGATAALATTALAATLDPLAPATPATPKAAGSASDPDPTRKDATSEEVVQWLMQMLSPAPAALPTPVSGSGAPGSAQSPGAQAVSTRSDGDPGQLLQVLATAVDPSAAHGAHPDPLTDASALMAASTGIPAHDTQPQSAAQAATLDPAIGASVAQLHAAASQLQPATATSATHTLQSPVGSSAWVEELGGHVALMAQQGNESASLQLTPPDLGPIEVRIAVHDSQASVWFGAAHTETRTALENALPRLRELFASQGMALADAGVFREPPRREQPLATATPSARTDEPETQTVTPVSNTRLGLIDTYA